MKTTTNIIVILGFILMPVSLSAQNDLAGKHSTWNVYRHRDMASGDVTRQSSIFKLNDAEIFWGPSENDGVSMAITGISGRWNADKDKGKVTYDVLLDQDSGIVVISGNGRKTRIKISITYNSGSSNLQLLVKSVSYN